VADGDRDLPRVWRDVADFGAWRFRNEGLLRLELDIVWEDAGCGRVCDGEVWRQFPALVVAAQVCRDLLRVAGEEGGDIDEEAAAGGGQRVAQPEGGGGKRVAGGGLLGRGGTGGAEARVLQLEGDLLADAADGKDSGRAGARAI
jgi:hypothetical protein